MGPAERQRTASLGGVADMAESRLCGAGWDAAMTGARTHLLLHALQRHAGAEAVRRVHAVRGLRAHAHGVLELRGQHRDGDLVVRIVHPAARGRLQAVGVGIARHVANVESRRGRRGGKVDAGPDHGAVRRGASCGMSGGGGAILPLACICAYRAAKPERDKRISLTCLEASGRPGLRPTPRTTSSVRGDVLSMCSGGGGADPRAGRASTPRRTKPDSRRIWMWRGSILRSAGKPDVRVRALHLLWARMRRTRPRAVPSLQRRIAQMKGEQCGAAGACAGGAGVRAAHNRRKGRYACRRQLFQRLEEQLKRPGLHFLTVTSAAPRHPTAHTPRSTGHGGSDAGAGRGGARRRAEARGGLRSLCGNGLACGARATAANISAHGPVLTDGAQLLDEEFDDFDVPAEIREARFGALKAEMEALRAAKESDHGSLKCIGLHVPSVPHACGREVPDEKAFFEVTTKTPLVICHFFHQDFRRCAILNKHLEALAPKHFKTKFIKVNVDNVPFVVARLKVPARPCMHFSAAADPSAANAVLLCGRRRQGPRRGLRGLWCGGGGAHIMLTCAGNSDSFTTQQLEARLAASKALTLAGQHETSLARKTVFGGFAKPAGDDSDDD